MSYEIRITKAVEKNIENAADYIERILYNTRPKQDGRVDILRFLYGKRDWASILGQGLSAE